MVEDIHAEEFELPEAFVSAFQSANGSDARMKVVGHFFEAEEITLGQDDWVALKPNGSHQVYLVGSSSLIHIERHEPEGTLYVVQPVQRKRGTIGKSDLEGQVVSQLKKGRKLWLLTRKAAIAVAQPRAAARIRRGPGPSRTTRRKVCCHSGNPSRGNRARNILTETFCRKR